MDFGLFRVAQEYQLPSAFLQEKLIQEQTTSSI